MKLRLRPLQHRQTINLHSLSDDLLFYLYTMLDEVMRAIFGFFVSTRIRKIVCANSWTPATAHCQRKHFCTRAAEKCHFDLVLWFNQWSLTDKFTSPLSSCDSRKAIGEHADIKFIEWCVDTHSPLSLCGVLEKAASVGRFDILKSLYRLSEKSHHYFSVGLFNDAARDGHLNIVRWLCSKFEAYSAVFFGAARGGRLNILEWATERHPPTDSVLQEIVSGAASGNHLPVIQWAVARGFVLNTTVLYCAAYAGHLSLVQWLLQNNCPFVARVWNGAASNGHLHVIKWVFENGLPCDGNLLISACKSSRLEIIKFLYERGHVLTVPDITLGIFSLNCGILNWLAESGHPYDDAFLCVAARTNDVLFIERFINLMSQKDRWETLWVAIINAAYDVVKFLLPLCYHSASVEMICHCAITRGHLEIIEWLHRQGYSYDRDKCQLWLTEEGAPPQYLKWLGVQKIVPSITI